MVQAFQEIYGVQGFQWACLKILGLLFGLQCLQGSGVEGCRRLCIGKGWVSGQSYVNVMCSLLGIADGVAVNAKP